LRGGWSFLFPAVMWFLFGVGGELRKGCSSACGPLQIYQNPQWAAIPIGCAEHVHAALLPPAAADRIHAVTRMP
jgi:hypothetical protein